MNNSTSKYDAVWVELKKSRKVRLKLEVEDQSTTELQDVETEKAFKRLRKAISHRKLVDIDFRIKHPNARVEVVSKDSKTAIIVIQLTYLTPDFTMLALKD